MKGSEGKLVKYIEGSDKRFVIPVYQRNCDWKIENCKQLYDDLVKITQNQRKIHFFGSLVSVYNPNGQNEEFLTVCRKKSPNSKVGDEFRRTQKDKSLKIKSVKLQQRKHAVIKKYIIITI